MKVEVTERFLKDAEKLKNKKVKARVDAMLTLIETATALKDVPNVKKLKGSKNAYRIRIGSYRIGFLFEQSTVKLGRLLDRKDIYDYFP